MASTAEPAPSSRRSAIALWVGVALVFAGLVTAYYFAFSAAHAAQIKDVPLATSGGRR